MSLRSISGLVIAALALLGCGDPSQSGLRPQRTAQTRNPIIGGVTDPAHWYVAMVGDDNDGFCSGTVISTRTLITAGHCWGTGADAITRAYFDTGNPIARSYIEVASSVRHPLFDDNSLTHDLTLVQLSADAPVQPAALLRETIDTTFIGPNVTWVGYGDTNSHGTGFGTRRVVTFPIKLIGPVAHITVPANAPQGASDSIDATQVYFQLLHKNTCSGDSGGPGFMIRSGLERHIGVTSYGDYDCAYDGVASRTDATTMDWIQTTLDMFEPGNACEADGICNASCVSTTPAPLGTLKDPDCADQHCGADGVCALGCSPVDPDCASLLLNNCSANGICDPSCAADVDCTGPSDGGAGGGSGTGGGSAAGGGTSASGGGSGASGGGSASGGGAAAAGGGFAATGGGASATGGGSDATGGGSDATGGGAGATGGGIPDADPDPSTGCHCGQLDAGLFPLGLLLLALPARRRRTPHA